MKTPRWGANRGVRSAPEGWPGDGLCSPVQLIADGRHRARLRRSPRNDVAHLLLRFAFSVPRSYLKDGDGRPGSIARPVTVLLFLRGSRNEDVQSPCHDAVIMQMIGYMSGHGHQPAIQGARTNTAGSLQTYRVSPGCLQA